MRFSLKPSRLGAAAVSACLVVATGGSALALAGPGASLRPPEMGASVASMPRPSRVAVLVLENKSYGQVIGNRNAPYLNALADRYALATHYYAVSHPSLPNYMALTGGSTFKFAHNCSTCATKAPNLVGQLTAAKVSWKAYFEGLTSNSRPGAITSTYNPHYNPFVYFRSVRGSEAGRSHVVGFRALSRDLSAGHLARFSWIAPGVHHDGHNSSLRQSDTYASRLVPRLVHALGPRGILYLTWDEGASADHRGVSGSRGGGHVALIAAGAAARRGVSLATPANHYALLRTIEAGFGLPALGNATSPTTPVLSGLLRP